MKVMKEDQLDLIFKALSDSTRRRIIDRLSKKPSQSLFEVCAASVAEDGAALSRQTVSQHLAVLEKAGLIEIEWKGRIKTHSLSVGEEHIAAALWLTSYKRSGTEK
ncbi:metalloregulator ArsR/SmtB family transcription factor [uncultured Ruegeria sp.]|uniref:ArsR/SmtB family transcription factor n=1 Tax=uncultured Ruegeria sp. TaxID=259304 RepID=UPI0026184954|nr:metalloregulator ArsR/SmtB family transcription factor [uncultured Ruegeria sp.]